MKRISFLLTLTGIFLLLFLLNSQALIIPLQEKNLSETLPNQKIYLSGKVTSQTSGKIILDNDIEIKCECFTKNYLDKNVSLIGIVKEYEDRKDIVALSIKEIK